MKLVTIDLSECSKLIELSSMSFANTSIESVKLPKSIKHFRQNIFRNCTKLKHNFNFTSNIEDFHNSIFIYCYVIYNVDPDCVKYKYFQGCIYNSKFTALIAVSSNIEQIEYHSNITAIAGCAFSASKVIEIKLPDTVTTMEIWGLHMIANVNKVILSSGLNVLNQFDISNLGNLEILIIPEGFQIMNTECLKALPKLKEIILPNSLRTISTRSVVGVNLLSHAISFNSSYINEYVRGGFPRRIFNQKCPTITGKPLYIPFSYLSVLVLLI